MTYYFWNIIPEISFLKSHPWNPPYVNAYLKFYFWNVILEILFLKSHPWNPISNLNQFLCSKWRLRQLWRGSSDWRRTAQVKIRSNWQSKTCDRDVCLGDPGAASLPESVRPRLHPLRLLHQQDPQAILWHMTSCLSVCIFVFSFHKMIKICMFQKCRPHCEWAGMWWATRWAPVVT